MNTENCNTNSEPPEKKPADWSIDELTRRAGALVREALAHYSVNVRQAHWEDMRQTAVIAFLEQADQSTGYAYATARNALKNYIWVHIRGLNGGWKSLAYIENGYTVLDLSDEADSDEADGPESMLDQLVSRTWDAVPRPVEWEVLRRLAPPGRTHEETLREVLHILAGMSGHYYPEQLYRAALIITMLARGYTWEHVEERTGLPYETVFDIYWGWRKRHLLPYLSPTPMHQAIIKLRGQMRITYKRRGRNARNRAAQMEASLQKGRQVNGRNCMRAVHLGKLGDISKERLYEASFAVEHKLAALAA